MTKISTLLWIVFTCGSLTIGLYGCLYDADQRCGENQEYINDACICLDGYIPDYEDNICVECPQYEIAKGNICVCQEGYIRPIVGASCQSSILGQQCDGSSDFCDEDFSICTDITDGSSMGYCTNACFSSDQCFSDYACNMEQSPGYCQKPPTGLGVQCQEDKDCSSYEAKFCDIFNSFTCLKANCELDKVWTCSASLRCCDITAMGISDIPDTACLSADLISIVAPMGVVCSE